MDRTEDYMDGNDYVRCLKEAGAVVHEFESFGDYQGSSWAFITYKGKTGWVQWCFGSCSGCDLYQHEFPSSLYEPTKEELSEFGMKYLDPILSQEEAEREAGKYSEWSHEDREALEFIKKSKTTRMLQKIVITE